MALIMQSKRALREITGKVHVDNTAMRLVYRKFGFQAEHLTMKREWETPDALRI